MSMHFSIPADHPCLPGHFPGHPLVPGVVVLEQVILALAGQLECPPACLRLPQVKFLAPLYPGQLATLALDGQAPRWKFSVSHAGRVLVRGELVLDDTEPA